MVGMIAQENVAQFEKALSANDGWPRNETLFPRVFN